jgi:hypothetical protein
MKSIAGWICQLALLAAATFLLVVLYEHGPADFMHNAQQEFGRLMNWAQGGDDANFTPPK